MKRSVLAAASALLLFVLAGCGGTHDSAGVSSSTQPSTIAPAGDYATVKQLAQGLTVAGISCFPSAITPTAKSEYGSCTLSSTNGQGIEASLTVWHTRELADIGIKASINASNVTGRISGERFYYVSGPTWLISLNKNAVAAGQIVGNFGGSLVRAGSP